MKRIPVFFLPVPPGHLWAAGRQLWWGEKKEEMTWKSSESSCSCSSIAHWIEPCRSTTKQNIILFLSSLVGGLFSMILSVTASSVKNILSFSKISSRSTYLFPIVLSLSFLTIPTVSSFSLNNSSYLMSASISNVSGGSSSGLVIDRDYPGTAVQRMLAVHERVKSLATGELNGDWEEVRRKLLWAGGLRDLPHAAPGQGYTGHSFNDFNHVDLTTMLDDEAFNENGGKVDGIHFSNQLGPGIKAASIPELGPGGSWSTCMLGCAKDPPQDVAHLQFRSRIAFKLVWAPREFTTFVLVDDNGKLLAKGSPTGRLPPASERAMNYRVVQGSKYAVEADKVAVQEAGAM